MSRVFVTGIGIITPIGSTLADNREALKSGRSGLSSLELFPTTFADKLPFGEIKKTNAELKELLRVTEPGITRTTLLALHAMRDAIQDSGLSPLEVSSAETAFINGTTVGGMCCTDELYGDAHDSVIGSEYLNSYDLCSVAFHIGQQYQMEGIVNTFNTACSSSANSIMYGARLIKNGLAKRAIVGGVDSLAKFTINGFNSLNILSSSPCRPFDANRSGLNLGEGSAFLILEKEEDLNGKRVYGEVSGWANTNDAFHPSSLSDDGEGPYLAMKNALAVAGLKASQIDYINTHGTATENNDEKESIAIQRLFEKPPHFSSTKSNIGHTLGAAGGIEAVFCLLNLQHGELYPSLNFENPIPTIGLIPVSSFTQASLNHAMSNSFGFGGNCSSLIFSKA